MLWLGRVESNRMEGEWCCERCERLCIVRLLVGVRLLTTNSALCNALGYNLVAYDEQCASICAAMVGWREGMRVCSIVGRGP